MSTVYSILFTSKQEPGKVAMCTHLTDQTNRSVIISTALSFIEKTKGDKDWVFKEMSGISINTPVKPKATNNEMLDISLDKNFLLKSIVDNKDKGLYASAQKYLSPVHCKYIESKLYENRIG